LTFGQPDGWISTRVSSRYVGDNVYNTTGYGQTKTAKATAARPTSPTHCGRQRAGTCPWIRRRTSWSR
jgi:hypothetical protein